MLLRSSSRQFSLCAPPAKVLEPFLWLAQGVALERNVQSARPRLRADSNGMSQQQQHKEQLQIKNRLPLQPCKSHRSSAAVVDAAACTRTHSDCTRTPSTALLANIQYQPCIICLFLFTIDIFNILYKFRKLSRRSQCFCHTSRKKLE